MHITIFGWELVLRRKRVVPNLRDDWGQHGFTTTGTLGIPAQFWRIDGTTAWKDDGGG